MRGYLHRALAALLALLLMAGQIQTAAAYIADVGDSHREPQGSCAQTSPATAPSEAEEEPTEAETETPVSGPTEARKQTSKQSPTEAAKQAPKQSPTETPKQSPTEAPKQTPTETPTETATDPPTQAPANQADTQQSADTAPEAPSEDGVEETVEQTIVALLSEPVEETVQGERANAAADPEAPEEPEVTITLSGELPEQAEVVAEDAVAQAEEAGLLDVICAYDITINDGWQPQAPVEVSIVHGDLPEGVLVYHIGADGTPEPVQVQRSEDGQVVFRAEGFSVYVVTENVLRREYDFFDYSYGQWLAYDFTMALPGGVDTGVITANRQILRNGDTLVVPSLPDKQGMRFLGWYTSPTADVNLMNPERGGVKNDITDNTIVSLYARYGKPLTITYYARAEDAQSNQVLNTQTVILGEEEDSIVLDLSGQLTPEAPAAGYEFVCWAEPGSDSPIDINAYELTGNISLYPIFVQLYHITFHSEGGLDAYIAPETVGAFGMTGQLTDEFPSHTGYTFGGWAVGGTPITDASNQLLTEDGSFEGGYFQNSRLYLTQDVTAEAIWIPQQVEYRVIFWQEKTTDTKKLVCTDGVWAVPDDQKEYDFMGTLRIDAMSGEEVPVQDLLDAYSGLAGTTGYVLAEGSVDFTGLVFRELQDGHDQTLRSFTVAGDGTNIVHVFYDREVVTMHFVFPDDVTAATAVAEPSYYPALPASGSVTQKAVTAVSSADYPESITFHGLYGGKVTDGKTDAAETPKWPVSYTVSNLSYTYTTRTMQYASGTWTQKSSSSKTVTEDSRTFTTMWTDSEGYITAYEEVFGPNITLTPVHTVSSIRDSSTESVVSFYKENTENAYPASAIYASTPALTFTALEGENVVVQNPFGGFELDYFTYTDSKGTPIRREGDATLAQRTITGGAFTNLKVYCKRSVHHLNFINGSSFTQGPGVKYGMTLATDYVKQSITTPDLPPELAAQEDELEFVGWFLDQECTIYLDFAGLKAGGRAKLMQQYDQIQMIVSVYDYRPAGGVTVPALKMDDGDMYLFAGWLNRRLLLQIEPDGGELPEDVYTFDWVDYGQTLNVFPVTRDYVPATQSVDTYVYHIHTYDQSQLDNDITDRTACYRPATEGDSGQRYAYQPDSYRFLGWFRVTESANGTEILTPYDHEQPVTEPLKLRAQWSRLGVYRITYNAGDHGELTGAANSAAYRDHATIDLRGDIAADTGYVFTGWRVQTPYGGGALMDTLYSSGDALVLNADWAETTMDEYTGEPVGYITLVAQYEPLQSTSITYYVNGGTYVGPLDGDPNAAELVQKLIRDYGASAMHSYLYDDDGVVIGYSVTGIEQNANITTEDGSWFQRSGYKLMGWSYSPTGSVDLELNTTGYHAVSDPDGAGHVLYAVWKPETQVIYNLQGGIWNSANGAEYRQENGNWIYGAGNGEQAPVPKAPTKSGYAFVGWHTSSTAKKGLTAMPTVSKSVTLYAVWTTDVVVRFSLNGGSWETAPANLYLMEKNVYGYTVGAGKSYTLPTDTPVKDGGCLFHTWTQGSYQYAPGEVFKTTAEQASQTLTFTAVWSSVLTAEDVLVGADDSVTVLEEQSQVGATDESASLVSPREIEGYQYLFAVYDELPAEKSDIAEHYRITAIQNLGGDSYRVTLANGQTKIHYPDSAEKLQLVYIQDRDVEVYLKRMNVFEDGMENMNITLTSLKDTPQTTLSVGKVDIQAALPSPNNYAKVGSTNYKSYTYAIGRQDAENMYAIDTMTKDKLWIRQTLNGFAFSVNGQEWKDLSREEDTGKDVAVYIIYDNRTETPTTIKQVVYGLKSDKEQLITYDVYVKGRWGFNIGNAAYFLNKPDDPSEKLNSYTVALHDGESVLIPLHIDYLTGYRQEYSPGDLFYDMFGNDNPTTITNRSEKRIWQEVEMRRTDELPFANGDFETSIQLRKNDGTSANSFNGYDKVNHTWLKQLGISKYYTNTFIHSFTYKRLNLDVPVHVLELTRDGYVLRDDGWLNGGAQTLSVQVDTALTVDNDLAATLTDIPDGYALQSIHYGLSQSDLEGTDRELVLKLAAELNNATLYHVYDYESADSSTRALVPDGSEVYLVYARHSSADVPVQYVKKDVSGAYTPVDLSGYGLTAPTVTVTDSVETDFRTQADVLEVNGSIEKLDALYLTGRILLADQKDTVLTTYQPGANGNWSLGREAVLRNSEAGVIYIADDGSQQMQSNVKVWVEVAANTPLRMIGRLWQRGSNRTNSGVVPYLPRDSEGRVVADGTFEVVDEHFAGFQNLPYASDDSEAVYQDSGLGSSLSEIYAVAYCTDEDGYRYWVYQVTDESGSVSLNQYLYADYLSLYSPLTVRYVVETDSGYAEVNEEDLKATVVHEIKVYQTGVLLSELMEDSVEAIAENSSLYRASGVYVLGSSDLLSVYYVSEDGNILLADSVNGLIYEAGSDSGTLTDYPDVYVLLQPIATLTVSKVIRNDSGYSNYTDRFTFTISLSDTSVSGDYTATVTKDDSVSFARDTDLGTRQVRFTNGTAVITLYHGQSMALPGLPRNVDVTVTEEPPELYNPSYEIKEGAKVTPGNTFRFTRHTTVAVTNVCIDITATGSDFSDRSAYAFLLCGAGAYGCYLLLSRRRKRR